MQTLADKLEESAETHHQTYDAEVKYIDWAFRSYPLESYTSQIKPYLRHDMEILEMGCRSGFFCFWLEWMTGTRIYGIDIAKEFIDCANQHAAKHGYLSSFACLDAENTGLPAESFDVIIMLDTLHHFPNTEDILKEVSRLLRPGGKFVCFEPNPYNLFHIAYKLHHMLRDGHYGLDHEHEYSRGHYTEYLEASGFDIIESRTIRYISKALIDKSTSLFNLDSALSHVPLISSAGFCTFIVAQKTKEKR